MGVEVRSSINIAVILVDLGVEVSLSSSYSEIYYVFIATGDDFDNRIQGYCLGSSRVGCANLITSTNDDLQQHTSGSCHSPSQIMHIRFTFLPNRWYQSSSSDLNNFCVRSCSLSSLAGTQNNESSGEDDILEDGFSELETPHAKLGDGGEDGDELLTELDDDEDVLEEASENELDKDDFGEGLQKNEILGEGLQKKRASLDLFKAVMDAPRSSFDEALNKWVEEGKPFGRSEITLAMLNLRKHRFYGKALQFSQWLEAKKHLEFTERHYVSRVDLISKVQGPLKAEKYIQSIPQSFRGEIIYRTLLANCVGVSNMQKAQEVFNKMRDLKFKITAFACNQLLLLYKKLDKKKMVDFLIFMEKENIKYSSFTYKLLMDVKGQSNDIAGMEGILEEMKKQGYDTDIRTQSMLARHYINAGFSEKAEAILKDVEGSDLKVNRGACQTLLLLYADLGKADEVRRIWKVCDSSPRVNECLAAIQAWSKLGKIEDAEAVFDMMMKTFKNLSAKCYTLLLKVYADHKMLAKGKDLVKRMSFNGCHIGPLTWDALVRLYVEAGEVEKADSILQKAVQQQKMKPLFSSFMTILDQYARRGDIHNAEKIFHRLKQAGYVGRLRQYQSLLQAYINAKIPAYGFRDRMKADQVFPNKVVAAQLAQVDAFRKTAISDLLD